MGLRRELNCQKTERQADWPMNRMVTLRLHPQPQKWIYLCKQERNLRWFHEETQHLNVHEQRIS